MRLRELKRWGRKLGLLIRRGSLYTDVYRSLRARTGLCVPVATLDIGCNALSRREQHVVVEVIILLCGGLGMRRLKKMAAARGLRIKMWFGTMLVQRKNHAGYWVNVTTATPKSGGLSWYRALLLAALTILSFPVKKEVA